uniref:Protein kinase domain-containing protein n=1 Tax=viral metagenome TaxID=1070528 RepID=A0A6C0C2Y9_9ZZZZ
MFDIYYKKNDNLVLFETLEKTDFTDIKNAQNYIPIYNQFFSLNGKNYSALNINHKYHMCDLLKKNSYSTYEINVKHGDKKIKRDVFFKYSPLLDPIKYLSGKYESYEQDKIIALPDLSNNCHKKILDYNNAAYVDSFFSYLTSRSFHEYKFIHGLDFYGSFIGLKNNYIINIAEDLEYLLDTKFFQENKNLLFYVEEGTTNFFSDSDSRTNKKPLVLNENVELKLDTINNDIFDSVFELTTENLNTHNNLVNKNTVYMSDISMNVVKPTVNLKHKSISNSSDSSCSSRISNTNSSKSKSGSVCSYNGTSTDNSSYSSISEELLECKIKTFPVQIICLEKMDDTLDSLLGDEFDLEESDDDDEKSLGSIEELSDEEWRSCLFQIIMTLIAYQKMFDFTHNDLHTNNIMYNNTEKKYLFYKYDDVYYKVPTYGRIYKIIDFGRAIYRYKNKVICSDSYHPKGDAATLYNCEPYLNDEKPVLKPNKSFDLCRLGCSLYDYFIDEVEDPKVVINPIGKLIVDWCKDDNGKNILYKTNGDERYPDFKLYKMIARTVHNHTPQRQLERGIFYKYQTQKKKIKKKPIMNIDNYPVHFTD